MNTPRNDPAVQNGRLPWPTWMTGPDHAAAAAAAAAADTIVLNRAALHDALTHDQPPRRRAATQPSTSTTSAPSPAQWQADTGPWLTLLVLGLVIVAAMLIITVTWT